MANLAFQLRGRHDLERGASLCEEALGLARKSGDEEAICEALNMRCALQSAPGLGAGRLRDADELVARADKADATELGLFGNRWRMLTMLELGDMEAADRELAAYDAAVDRSRVWSGRWYGLTVRAARALAEARFDAAERMVVESFAHRRDETTPLIIGVFATQLFWLRREQGRLQEVEHLRRHQSPRLPFKVLRTLLEAELGNVDAARQELTEILEHYMEEITWDFTYLYIVSTLAESCIAMKDERYARRMYDMLRPHADHYVILFLGSLQLGSVGRHLGRLAGLLGDTEAANHHFAHALEANQRIGAHLWAARTRLDWAHQLAAQGPEDGERARDLLRPCLADAHERGMSAVAREARELMDRLPI